MKVLSVLLGQQAPQYKAGDFVRLKNGREQYADTNAVGRIWIIEEVLGDTLFLQNALRGDFVDRINGAASANYELLPRGTKITLEL